MARTMEEIGTYLKQLEKCPQCKEERKGKWKSCALCVKCGYPLVPDDELNAILQENQRFHLARKLIVKKVTKK